MQRHHLVEAKRKICWGEIEHGKRGEFRLIVGLGREYEAEAPAVEASKAESAAKAPSAVPAAAPATTTATKKEGSSTPAAAAAAPVEKSEEDQKAVLIAELEKRIARAKRYGLATEEAEKQLERAIKFGVESTQDKTLSALDGGLKGGKRREEKAEKKATPVAGPKEVTETANKKGAEKTPVPAETEEEKAARIARQEADEAAKKRRAERFGLSAPSAAAATQR
jgi:SAP domain-containing ribonucleoprotein